jgi:hypothetical protein
MASKLSMSSHFSVNADAPTHPVLDSWPTLDSASNVGGSGRQRVDSTRSRVDSFRSRTDSAKLMSHSPHLLPQVLEPKQQAVDTFELDIVVPSADLEQPRVHGYKYRYRAGQRTLTCAQIRDSSSHVSVNRPYN